MSRRIIFATGNEHKLAEIRAILKDLDVEIVSMKEAGIDVNIVEDGSTFEENALIKARTVGKKCGQITMADDSGLVIDYLNGEPGIYSSRYLGADTSYDIKNRAILERMKGVPDEKRTARFVCSIVCVFPDGRELKTTKTMEGIIGHEIAGSNGFGYDPIFYLPQLGCTSAQLPAQKKNEISHRGKALREMYRMLKETI